MILNISDFEIVDRVFEIAQQHTELLQEALDEEQTKKVYNSTNHRAQVKCIISMKQWRL